jgi:hypothetical protein
LASRAAVAFETMSEKLTGLACAVHSAGKSARIKINSRIPDFARQLLFQRRLVPIACASTEAIYNQTTFWP